MNEVIPNEHLDKYQSIRKQLEGSNIIAIVRLRHRMQRGQGFTLDIDDIIDKSVPQLQCLDPRDRVYSILSLLDTEKFARYPIYPDYSKAPLDLLHELKERHCKQHANNKNRDYEELRAHIVRTAEMLHIEHPRKAAVNSVHRALTMQAVLGEQPVALEAIFDHFHFARGPTF